jgi:alanine dehydrogenase
MPMIVGVPTEIKTREYRVALIPAGVKLLVKQGNPVLVQSGAGLGSGITDDDFANAGAEIVPTAADVWKRADMVVKVKEPLSPEFPMMREGQILFTYLHLAAAPEVATELLRRKVDGVAYETIETADRLLPLLTPMSAVAGRMAIQVGATYLEKANGGKGILLGGVAGVRRGKVAILGGGVVGSNAARVAMGLGAQVTVLDVNISVLSYLDDIYQGRIHTLYSDPITVEEAVKDADLVVGAVLVAGARAPTLVSRELVSRMQPGTVIVDVAVDQGGCIETCRPTTHDDPTYVIDGVVHYCVANMPGAVPRTSTYALTNATIKYALKIARDGLVKAAQADLPLLKGINTFRGHVPHAAVANAVGVEYTPFEKLL